jgi:hypothetical protein
LPALSIERRKAVGLSTPTEVRDKLVPRGRIALVRKEIPAWPSTRRTLIPKKWFKVHEAR